MKNLKKFLVMGLPGSGKTTLAKLLAEKLNAVWLNADVIRKKNNDWDFSEEGRNRQAQRMLTLSKEHVTKGKKVIADFVCPTEKTRKYYNADFIIWMDTIEKGRFEDTNQMFQKPKKYDFKVTKKDAINVCKEIINKIITK